MTDQIFNRVISVTRPVRTFSADTGLTVTEEPIADQQPASIQWYSTSSSRAKDYPAPSDSDAPVNSWKIFVNLPLGTIKKGDKITDDLGDTYQVDAPYHTGIFYQLMCRDYTPYVANDA
jgi:hypothetical protein